MTVRRIMILLYGAGGVPGRGEIPMIQICSKCANPFIDSYMLLEIDILKGDRVYFSAG